MTTLGVDTSNYATSLAVVDTSCREVLYSSKQMLPVQEGHLGLRQSDAVFEHMRVLPDMLEELCAKVDIGSLKAVGVSEKPRPVEGSYMPCFLMGLGYARTIAAVRDITLVPTTHQQGHIAAALYGAGQWANKDNPMLVFHISGGTTELLLTRGYQVVRLVGTTLDLYAGQAVDRLGVRLGFPFPAGADLSRLASTCDDKIRVKASLRNTDCHLSGLQNQCDGLLKSGKNPAYVARYCLLAIAETVVGMIRAAREEEGSLPVLCAGGVMSSVIIRAYVESNIDDVYFVGPEYAGDNAIGVALIAAQEAVNA